MEWPRGEATDCKSVYTGSNPVSTSIAQQPHMWEFGSSRAIGAVVARFLDTEEVTGSNPVSPTTSCRSGGRLPSGGRPSVCWRATNGAAVELVGPTSMKQIPAVPMSRGLVKHGLVATALMIGEVLCSVEQR